MYVWHQIPTKNRITSAVSPAAKDLVQSPAIQVSRSRSFRRAGGVVVSPTNQGETFFMSIDGPCVGVKGRVLGETCKSPRSITCLLRVIRRRARDRRWALESRRPRARDSTGDEGREGVKGRASVCAGIFSDTCSRSSQGREISGNEVELIWLVEVGGNSARDA
jgi:hypothetical protein